MKLALKNSLDRSLRTNSQNNFQKHARPLTPSAFQREYAPAAAVASILIIFANSTGHAGTSARKVAPNQGGNTHIQAAATNYSKIMGASFQAAPGATPAAKAFDVHNPKLKAPEIKKEAVTSLISHPEWHLIKSPTGFRLYSKPDSTGKDSGGDKSTCGVLNSFITALSALQSQLSSAAGTSNSSGGTPVTKITTSQQNGFCVAEIANALPPAIRGLLDQHSYFDGPSGWTAVLYINQMINTQRAVDESEFTQLMNSPVCHTLAKTETPAAGDIGIVRFHIEDGRYREQNAFVRVAPDMLFTRDDDARSTPYALESMNYFLTTQKLNTLPARCRDDGASNNSGCPTELLYKRCASLLQYRAQHPLDAKAASMSEALNQVVALEKRIEPLTLGRTELTDPEFDSILDVNGKSFDAFSSASADLVKKVDPSDSAWLYAGQTRSILVGIATQISGIAVQKSNEVKGETKLYAHEPWQGVILGTQIPVGPNGPVTRYLLCAPFSKDAGCPIQ